MRNQRPSGLLCGCGATRILCECIRDQDHQPCCWACEHHDLPADIRPALAASFLRRPALDMDDTDDRPVRKIPLTAATGEDPEW